MLGYDTTEFSVFLRHKKYDTTEFSVFLRHKKIKKTFVPKIMLQKYTS